MKELVIKNDDGSAVTTSLLVADKFQKEHKHVLESVRNLVAENSAANKLFIESKYEIRGRNYPMYIMNRDGFSLLVMGFTGKQALQFKLDFIEAFNEMEAILKSNVSQIPQNLSQALRLAADQAEKIENQQKQLTEQAPKVLFADSVTSSKESILIGELAKLICQNGVKTGEKRLFQWLRDNNYLCEHGLRYNQPTQRAVEMGLFELRKTTINVGSSTKVRTTTKVTGKGQVFFINKFLYNAQNGDS